MGFGPLDKTHSVIYTDGTLKSVVTVAQSAELWIVAPAVVGSSPIGHPSLKPPRKVVTLSIVCPLRINFSSNSSRTNFASSYLPSSKLRPLATDLIEKHA